MKLAFDPVRVIKSRFFSNLQRPSFDYQEIIQGNTWACTDLGAFRRPLQPLRGVKGVVIMEDRDPEFFLGFRHYKPTEQTHLNRHGPLQFWSTQQDLKHLVRELHEQKINVLIGFWNYGGWGFGLLSRASWLRSHPELQRVAGSSDLEPFVNLDKEGISYADFIAHQYQKLAETFEFDGLMLGDGFCGYRAFGQPDTYRDREETAASWTDFYRVIAETVHRTKGQLFAYDCMGYSVSEAQRHGADYRHLSEAGLDTLVFQSYPQAWGEHWLSRYAERFDLDACAVNLRTVKKALRDTKTKVLYSLELGDSVEKWWAEPQKTKKQMERLDCLADGRFLVWANDIFGNVNS